MQVIEDDAEVFFEVRLVVVFKGLLRWCQARALRVVDQVQLKVAARLAVAQRVEFAQAGDAALKNAITTLDVDIVTGITGQGGRYGNLLGGKKLSQILMARLGQDGQIAAVDNLDVRGPGAPNQRAELRVHFWRATGQVQGIDRVGINHLAQQLNQLGRHTLGAGWPGVDVAMQAALVAAVGQVDLQRVQRASA